MELYRGKANHLYGYTTLNVFNRQSLAELAHRTGFEILSYRTEWLDIYITDLTEYYDRPDRFIHKRNCQISNYEERIMLEDAQQREQNLELNHKGNYMVAVMGKAK
jgi:hypothetical protein